MEDKMIEEKLLELFDQHAAQRERIEELLNKPTNWWNNFPKILLWIITLLSGGIFYLGMREIARFDKFDSVANDVNVLKNNVSILMKLNNLETEKESQPNTIHIPLTYWGALNEQEITIE